MGLIPNPNHNKVSLRILVHLLARAAEPGQRVAGTCRSVDSGAPFLFSTEHKDGESEDSPSVECGSLELGFRHVDGRLELSATIDVWVGH